MPQVFRWRGVFWPRLVCGVGIGPSPARHCSPPVLADEKEEAACTDAEVLAHLRGQGRTSAAAGAAPAKGV